MREMILEGVVGIVEGLNPKLIRTKLEAYAHAEPPKVGKAPKALKGVDKPSEKAVA
jgi:flagellar motor component MotA